MDSASTIDFARAARALAHAARRAGVAAPSFRCPPRLVGADRTIRRRRGGAVVSVRVRGRPREAVLADMVEGVVVASGLVTPGSDRLRSELWEALCADSRLTTDVAGPPSMPGAA